MKKLPLGIQTFSEIRDKQENYLYEVLLFQTGYLTIKEVKPFYNTRYYALTYPNLEVTSALDNTILLTRWKFQIT